MAPPCRGGIGIVRLSGAGSLRIAARLAGRVPSIDSDLDRTRPAHARSADPLLDPLLAPPRRPPLHALLTIFQTPHRCIGEALVKLAGGGAETDPEDLAMVERAWDEAAAAIQSGDWDLIVLDEINYAIGYKMLDAGKVAAVLRDRPEMLHVILTGRNAHPVLVELADTVTEMREVKHAYQKGILAQRGIEF